MDGHDVVPATQLMFDNTGNCSMILFENNDTKSVISTTLVSLGSAYGH